LRFDNPHVCLLLGSQAVEVGIKVGKLDRQDVRVRYNIEQIFVEASCILKTYSHSWYFRMCS